MNRALALWAGAGVPAFFFACVGHLVRIAEGKPPFAGAISSWALALAAALLATGAWAVARRARRHRVAVVCVYSAVMTCVLAAGTVVASLLAGDIQ